MIDELIERMRARAGASPVFETERLMAEAADALQALSPGSTGETEGWRDIESDPPPKDGTALLLWSRYCSNPCVCEFRNGQWAVMADGVRAVEHMSDFGTDYHVFDVPSHWQPIKPPSAMLSAAGER